MATFIMFFTAAPLPVFAQPVLETVLYRFAGTPDGVNPQPGLTLINGTLYGTTATGGIATNFGTAFKVNIDATGYTLLRNFTNTPDSGIPGGELLFGSDGVLYGTAATGGANNLGTIYKMHVDGGGYQILHDFSGAPDGSHPILGLMQATNGALYGTTLQGGTNNQGAIFTLQTNGTGYKVLYSFTNSPDGAGPAEALMQGSDGALYSTTFSGGLSNKGTIFKIQLDGGGYQILHTFTNSPDGANPRGTLLEASDGALYGVTQNAGATNFGTVFKINSDGSGYAVLHDFTNAPDGGAPIGGLVEGLDNLLYGVTGAGGNTTLGTIYRIHLGGGGYQTVYSFPANGDDGFHPLGGLTRGASIGDIGVLYGATTSGGSGFHGTVYAVVVNPSLSITPVVDRSPSNGPIVFWPAFAYNYVLQTTTNLSSGPWVNVTTGVPFTGLQITNLSNSSAAYFRLIWPP